MYRDLSNHFKGQNLSAVHRQNSKGYLLYEDLISLCVGVLSVAHGLSKAYTLFGCSFLQWYRGFLSA